MSELGQYLGNGLVLGAIYALMAAGLTLVFGYMGVVNFAHGEFYMIGAYLAYTVTSILGWPFAVGVLFAALGAAVLGLLINWGILQPLRKYETLEMPMLATIGLAIMLPNVAIILWNPVPKAAGSPVPAASIDLGIMRLSSASLFVIGMALLFILCSHLFINRTRAGLTMRGTFQDSTASWLMGVNVTRVYALTFVFGAVLAALSGVLIATIFNITPAMGTLATAKSFVVVILGGLGSFPGAVAGGLLLGLVEGLGAGYISAGYKDTFGLLVLILVLLLRPQGLFGAKRMVQE
ncbi:MAG TPA: branched-chain amino acid ABC transporter permease [Marmoricola sp.]|nr:branched-chain amino acid ABC transporter permease [Marmoricola sp.]